MKKKEKIKNRLINQQILNIIYSENLFQKEIEINKRNLNNENDNKKIFKWKIKNKKKNEKWFKKNIIKKKNILDNKEEENKIDFFTKLKINENKNIEQRKNKNNQKILLFK